MSDYTQPQSTLETLLEQARRLSSGTLATLTGKTLYTEIDEIRLEFIEFCEENSDKFKTWQPAWWSFIAAKAPGGYEIKYNNYWGYYQISHPEEGACIAEFRNGFDALEWCKAGTRTPKAPPNPLNNVEA